MPRLTIALPVFNGGKLLEATLQNLKDQTAGDFEAIIFDNASTDNTHEIASRFSNNDKRFRVVRRAETLSMFGNFRQTLDDTDSEFMMWRAYDDLSALNYIEALAEVLNQSPKLVLAGSDIHSQFLHVGRQFIRRAPILPESRLLKALVLMERVHPSWMYGMFRRTSFAPMVNQAIDGVPFRVVDHSMLFPALMNGQIGLTNKTHFIQQIGVDLDKTPYPTHTSQERWQIFSEFRRYCSKVIDETDFNPVAKAILKANLWRYVSKNSFRLRRILKLRLKGQ